VIFLRSLIFNLLYVCLTLCFAALLLPLLLLPSAVAQTIAKIWTRSILFLLRTICGISTEIRGTEHIQEGSAIYASLHQSAWETLFLWSYLANPSFVLKRELVWIPFFGLYLMRTSNIWIDRSAGSRSLRRMLALAAERVKQGCSIIIFPHGTRLVPGAKAKMHSGVAAIYAHAKVPVVPVALNSGLHWGKRAFFKKPGVITIEFLPAIAPGMDSKAFMKTLEERIENAAAKLLFTS